MRKGIIFGVALILVIVFFLLIRNSIYNATKDNNSSINSTNLQVKDNFDNVDEKIRCVQDSDCVFIVNTSVCCCLPEVSNLETLQKYDYFALATSNYECDHTKCDVCTAIAVLPPSQIKCELNKCTPYYNQPD